MSDNEIVNIKNKIIINPTVFLCNCVIILFLLSAIRVGIGTDYTFYSRIYLYGLEERLDLGIIFEGFSNFFRSINAHFQIFVAFNSLIVAVGIYYFILEYSDYYYISIITFLGTYSYFASFNIFRQFTSLGLVIIALVLFNKHKRQIWGLLVYIISIGIHLSSIAYLPTFFMRFINLSKKVYITILMTCFFSYLFIPESVKVLVFSELMSLNSFYYEKYQGSVFSESEGRSIMNMLFYLFYWSLTLILIINTVKIKKDERWLIQGFLLYLLLESILPYSNLSQRISYFFEILAIFIIPNSISTINSLFYKNLLKFAVISIFLIRVIYVLSLNGDGVVPFKSIFG